MPTINAKRSESKDKKTGKVIPAFNVSADIDFGANLEGMIAKYGESVVYRQALSALTVAFQGWLRSQAAAGKSKAEIDKGAAAWKPGERKAAKSPQDKLKELLASMSPEDRAAVLKDYKSKAA